MSKLKLNTKDENLREILGNGKKYEVPKFQRDYSWESEHLDTLWEDIQDMIDNDESYHYMGYLVLQEKKSNEYKIIDGQQRLTTFSIFVLACIKRLKEIQEEKIADILSRNFIGVEEFDGIHINRKLKLNKNNDFYYGQAVSGQELPQRGKKKTVHLMRKAIDHFSKKVQTCQGEEIGKLVQEISQRLLFTTIYIGDDLNAYRIFETLNARGVHLSSGDLLKNYLFSLIDDESNISDEVLEGLENTWEAIGSNIGNAYYTDYILCQWNSTHKIARKGNLFTSIRKEIKDKQSARNYLDGIYKNSEVYEAITNPGSDYFKGEDQYQSIKQSLEFLKLFSIKQPFSLLMISYQKYPDNFHKILKWIHVFSLRYNVICSKPPNEQERLYNDICLEINKGLEIQRIKEKLLKLYPNDKEFHQNFSDKTMLTRQSNKKARYLLARLEEKILNTSIDESKLTVEHILPHNPEPRWFDAFGNNCDLFSQRIGNMALVTASENKQLAQKPFLEKKRFLLTTHYNLNKNIEDYEEWTSAEVESRQKKIARIATDLWKI